MKTSLSIQEGCAIKKWTEDGYIQCPYYRKEDPRTIVCEGVEEDHSLQLVFASAPRQRDYKGWYCRNRWKRCPIACMLNQKYDYDPN